MKIDHKKLSVALSAIWVLISIPISEHFYKEVLDGGFFMRSFALITVASPVWLYYGLNWLTNGIRIQKKHLAAIIALGAGLGFLFSESRGWHEIAYIPLITSTFFAFLNQVNSIFSEKGVAAPSSQTKLPRTPSIGADNLKKLESLKSKIQPLVDITHEFATEILKLLYLHRGRSPMPEFIHADADAVKAAYALLYAAFLHHRVKRSAHQHTAIIVMYQATISQNLITLVIPRTGEAPSLSPSDMDSEVFRGPVREIIKLQEKYATEALSNITSCSKNPLLPIYQIFKPYFSSNNTDEDLSAIFEEKFNDMFATAKKEVFLVLL